MICNICMGARLPSGIGVSKQLFYKYKGSAKFHNRVFTLSFELFGKLTRQNCYYCNTPPSQSFTKKTFFGSYIYNGIDRIDSNIGYIPSNCVPCCKTCNYMKLGLSIKEFIDHTRRILLHLENDKILKNIKRKSSRKI